MQESDYVEFRKKSSPLNYIEGGTNERLSICAENEIFGQQPRELGSEQNKLQTKNRQGQRRSSQASCKTKLTHNK